MLRIAHRPAMQSCILLKKLVCHGYCIRGADASCTKKSHTIYQYGSFRSGTKLPVFILRCQSEYFPTSARFLHHSI